MKILPLKSVVSHSILGALVLIFLTNCEKTPTPGFSYSPSTNMEAGDSIHFFNESVDALSFEWDFGDGTSSTDENPVKIYLAAGSIDVSLTSTNETKSALVTKTIQLNDPTTLGLFVYEMEGEIISETPIANCDVWIYDNQTDMMNIAMPMNIDVTDSDGLAIFMNLEVQTYYILCFKDHSETHYWMGLWEVSVTELNKTHAYSLGCYYEAYESSTKKRKQLTKDLIISEVMHANKK